MAELEGGTPNELWDGRASEIKIQKSRYGSLLGVQVCFDEFSWSLRDHGFTSVYNQSDAPLLESAVIEKMINAQAHKRADFFGVLSWKTGVKTGMRSETILRWLEQVQFQCDVLAPPFKVYAPSVWLKNGGARMEPTELLEIGQWMLRYLGWDVDLKKLDTPYILQNAFFARTQVWELFYKELFGPALSILRDPPTREFSKLLKKTAAYRVPKSLVGRVKTIFGTDQYSMAPFIGERLFATWIALKIPLERPVIYVPKLPEIHADTLSPD